MLQEDFDFYFSAFVNEMRAKFSARHQRQHERGNKSVLDPGFRFAEDLSLSAVEDHFTEEIRERVDLAKTWAEKCHEDIDVANMAFLDWAIRKARSFNPDDRRTL